MSKLVIQGGVPLCGVVEIQGAKNSILPILAATVLCEGTCVIRNCPEIRDTETAIEILTALGARIKQFGTELYVDTAGNFDYEISDALMRKMRSSIMFLGAIIARKGRAFVSFPGGCELGPRPIDLHIAALSRMGVRFEEYHGFIKCETDGLVGNEIHLSFPSVGATENVMMAAVLAKGRTVIHNAAREPEIEDLQAFLNRMGGHVSGAGSSTVEIEGVPKLHPATHSVIPDRIVAATYLCAVAATRGNALLKHCNPEHLRVVLSCLEDAGCQLELFEDAISVSCDSLRAPGLVRTMPYPGFPTDLQAPVMALMCLAKGSTVFVETIFESRFKHVPELMRMGARITTEGRVAVVEGVGKLYGANLDANELRGGASLVVAALAAGGETTVNHVEYIDRGYARMETVLSQLGATVQRE